MDYSTLKQQIVDDIKQDAESSTKALKKLIQDESATYQTAAEYSKVLGDAVSKGIQKNIADGIPDEELEAFAKDCLAPVYRQSQDTMLSACKSVQSLYNKQADINLNPVNVERDESRIEHIVDRFTEASKFDEVKFLTGSNVSRSITRGAVQDSMKANAKFQSDAGLETRISRSDGSGCCDWCSSVTGTFDSFDKLPDGFWGIHQGCGCVIDYRVGKTRNKISFKTNEYGSLEKVTEEIENKSYENKVLSDTIKIPDEIFKKSVGAKFYTQPVKDIETGEYFSFVENSKLQNSEIFSGNGTSHPLKEEVKEGLSKIYEVTNIEEWQHGKSDGVLDYYGEERKAEVHWFSHPSTGKVEFKVKKWYD